MNNKNYNLTRSEFANTLGISVDTLKKRMKRGHLKDQYILKDGIYLFTGDTKVGPKQEKIKPMSLGTKRIRNRGNHFNSKNPNYKPQFQRTNEIRMLAKLKHNVSEDVQELLPEAIEIAKQKKREKLQERLNETIPKNYGGFVNRYNSTPIVDFRTPWRTLQTPKKDEYDKYLEDNDLNSKPTKSYY